MMMKTRRRGQPGLTYYLVSVYVRCSLHLNFTKLIRTTFNYTKT